MRFAYADPPYLGLAAALYGKRHPEAAVYDTIDAHRDLIDRLSRDYPDGWAYSLHSPALRQILPLCPDDVRVLAWVKPFASFKPGVRLAYAWEPILLRGCRQKSDREEATVRDWFAANIAMKKGLPGAKPVRFALCLFDMMGCEPGDTLDDLFPGTGIIGAAFRARYYGEPMSSVNAEMFP